MQERLRSALVNKLLAVTPAKDTSYFDIELPRFALRVKPTGKASYFIRYTSKATGRETRIVVGDARVLSLEAARKAARSLLAQVDTGGDPKTERDEDRSEWTFNTLWASYRNSDVYRSHAPKSQSTDASRWNVHIAPQIGKVKLTAFDVPAAKRLYSAIGKPKSGHDTGTRGIRTVGGLGTARKALRLVSAMLTYAVEIGQIERNPLIGQFRVDGDQRRDTILGREDYLRLFTGMDEMVAVGTLRAVSRDALFFLAATGCRRGEALKLRWSHIDFQKRLATLPFDQHKTGRKTRTARSIGLVPAVLDILERRRAEADSEDALLFPPSEGATLNLNREWVRIRSHLGLPSDLVIHSLRHSLASHAAMAGLSAHELMAALGHRQVSTTTRYIRFAEQQARVHDRAAQAALGDLALSSRTPTESLISSAGGQE